jgi:ribonuclease E
MKRMLFNATHAEELRVAIVDGQKLIDLDLESVIRSEKKGNIYKGIVTKVEPSLEACFVDYGAEKQGFLPLKEIYREYFKAFDSKTSMSDVRIDSVIKEGMEMIIQVDKDERGTKGAALTTFISLAGRYLVFMPNNPKGGGISRRISGEERNDLRQILSKLSVDSKHSLIARTEGIGRSEAELQWDLDFLVKLWDTIEEASKTPKAPFLIYQESNLIVRSIRDHLSDDISEIVVDDEEVYDRAKRFIEQVVPSSINKLKIYKDAVPLFSRYQIENQINSAFNREVTLPSGGALAIDHTEALISIDVNSARATKGHDIEETALQTNLEAVEEVARQLRIRDIGGLVVIDLIDMSHTKNQKMVENRLKDSLQADRARVQVGHISRFGLLEMSRQRLRSSISDQNYRTCPRCEGMGTIRSVVSSSLNLMRIIEDEALKENTEAVQVAVPIDMATYLLNEKRHELYQLEAKLASRIIVIPSDELASPHFKINRLKSDEFDEISNEPSFAQKIEIEATDPSVVDTLKTAKPERARVQLDQINHSAPPPEQVVQVKEAPVKPSEPGLIKKIFSVFTGPATPEETVESTETIETEKRQNNPQRRGQGRSNNQNTRGRGGQNRGRDNRRANNQGGQSRNQQRTNQDARSESEEQSTQDKGPGRPQNRNNRTNNRNNSNNNPKNSPRSNQQDDQSSPSSSRSNQSPAQGEGQSNPSGGRSNQSQGQGEGQNNRNGPRQQNRGSSSGSRRRPPAKQQPHPGPIISADNAPRNLPDDIGNRKT